MKARKSITDQKNVYLQYFTQEQHCSQSRSTGLQKPLCVLHSSTQERHYLDECSKFQQMTVANRMKLCDEEKLCRLCLKRNHVAKRSRHNKSCTATGCKKMHHPLLHKGESLTEVNSLTPPPPRKPGHALAGVPMWLRCITGRVNLCHEWKSKSACQCFFRRWFECIFHQQRFNRIPECRERTLDYAED